VSTPAPPEQLTVLLAEYGQLKDEQAQRIGHRDNLVYATLTAAAATIVGAVQTHAAALLLALAPVCVLLGWTYLANDRMVTAIGRYLRDELAPRLESFAGAAVLGWEREHPADTRRRQRKCFQLAANLLTFVLPGAAAAIAAVVAGRPVWLVIVGAVVAFALLAVLAWQIVAHADLPPKAPCVPDRSATG